MHRHVVTSCLLISFLLAACGRAKQDPALFLSTPPSTTPEIHASGVTTRPIQVALPKALVIFEAKTGLFVIHADGTGLTQLTYDQSPLSPACSPDGNWIAYTSIRDQNYDIYLVHSDGSGETRITQDPKEDSEPAWSPDSNFLLFTSARNGKPQIYRMRRDGSEVTQITDLLAGVYGPKWSPDGKEIAFGSSSEIYVMNGDGTSLRQITKDFTYAGYPAWSPDSTRLAFYASTADSDAEIYIVNRDGSGLYRLTDHKRDGLTRSYSPSWSPDGGWIVFYAQQAGEGNWTVQIIPALSPSEAKLSNQRLSTPITGSNLDASNPCWMVDTSPKK